MDNDAADKELVEASVPSCESCRKRKLKCPRQQPSCSSCDRLDVACIYVHEKKKPGFRVGAVESLSRRLDIVETAVLNSQRDDACSRTTRPESSNPRDTSSQTFSEESFAPFAGVLSSLTKELHNLSSTIASVQRREPRESYSSPPPAKRKRQDNETNTNTNLGDCARTSSTLAEIYASRENLNELSEEIIDVYFRYVHPFLSIVHEPSFRSNNQTSTGRHGVVSHAMAVAALRFVKQGDKPLSPDLVDGNVETSRNKLLSSALSSISVESVQALLILIYCDISNGDLNAAWSLLAVVWQHIRCLDQQMGDPQHKVSNGLFGSRRKTAMFAGWIEEEEWRRIFWNTFMIDRVCAASLGHIPTGIHGVTCRKLPACSSFWFTNQPRPTPYLRVSDSSTAALKFKIQLQDPADEALALEDANYSAQSLASSGVGSLAFYVESMESMSLVITHFLSLEVDFRSRNDVSRWLTRFRDIDQHLMRWKTRLPQQWVDSGVSRRIIPGVMDPAMVVANATHNTCLIMLHEPIAYPDTQLSWVKLPTRCSSETCQSAAIEVCSIICRILEQRTKEYPLTPQLGLCAFVTARTMLLHMQSQTKTIVPAFWLLVQCLDDMAQRWQVTNELDSLRPGSIFSHLAERLRSYHANIQSDPTYHIDKTEPLPHLNAAEQSLSARHWISPDHMATYIERQRSDLKGGLPLTANGTVPTSESEHVARQRGGPASSRSGELANSGLGSQLGLHYDTSSDLLDPIEYGAI